jgi:hypothetical protein
MMRRPPQDPVAEIRSGRIVNGWDGFGDSNVADRMEVLPDGSRRCARAPCMGCVQREMMRANKLRLNSIVGGTTYGECSISKKVRFVARRFLVFKRSFETLMS